MDYKSLTSRLSMTTGLPQQEIENKITALANALATTAQSLNSVAIPGFGTFSPLKTDEHVVSQPDGTRTLMPPAISVQFKSSVILRKALGK